MSPDFREKHNRVRNALGMTDENSTIVRLTHWVELGTPIQRLLKGLVLLLILCVLFATWHMVTLFILLSDLYYHVTLSDFCVGKSSNSATIPEDPKPKLMPNQSEGKVQLNKRFSESFAIMVRTVEISTESIFQLILQLHIAIYSDFKPGLLQLLSMSTSFVSLVFGTFCWNSQFEWNRKYRDGLKAIPLYVLSIMYKCLSITTMIAVFKYYSAIPLVFLVVVLATIYYRSIADAPKGHKILNVGSIYLRYESKIM